ncbi:MAG: hypothetical protein Q8Q58_11945 [Candidatus Rokubacteria bacterium]|nr:hypothetical protein [Candidatus Rokubacteria bacterium]
MFLGDRELTLRDFPDPNPGPGDVGDDPPLPRLRALPALPHGLVPASTVGQEECVRFVARRKIPLGRLLTPRFALEQAAEAYRLFDTQTTGKGVFVTVP